MSETDDSRILFDNTGVCHHCREFDIAWAMVPKTKEESDHILLPVVDDIKRSGRGKKYDCLIGLSGGVDSTYIAMLTRDYGLRPLAVHFDNGWNSELAVQNIESVISKLDIDLVTVVIDWDDFRELQLAYLRASVVDIEVLTDHAIYGSLFDTARGNDIRYILSGVNVATEYVLPNEWIFDKLDFENIQSIYKQYGRGKKLSNYPFLTHAKLGALKSSRFRIVNILDMTVFDVARAKERIARELAWRDYEGKHFESIFTRFYQGYILPIKFGIHKRKAHLSNLICCGAMTRQQALNELAVDNYPPERIAADMQFVLKKLKLSRSEFDELMGQPRREHREFDNYRSFFSKYPVFAPLKPAWEMYRDNILAGSSR